jgi:hypothetical protein
MMDTIHPIAWESFVRDDREGMTGEEGKSLSS